LDTAEILPELTVRYIFSLNDLQFGFDMQQFQTPCKGLRLVLIPTRIVGG